MLGPFLMLMGVLLMWIAIRNKSDPMLNVLLNGTSIQEIQNKIGAAFTNFLINQVGGAIGGAMQNAVSNALSGLKFSGPGFSFNYVPPQPIYIPNPDDPDHPLRVLT